MKLEVWEEERMITKIHREISAAGGPAFVKRIVLTEEEYAQLKSEAIMPGESEDLREYLYVTEMQGVPVYIGDKPVVHMRQEAMEAAMNKLRERGDSDAFGEFLGIAQSNKKH